MAENNLIDSSTVIEHTGQMGLPLPQEISGLDRAAKISLGFGGHVACGMFESI